MSRYARDEFERRFLLAGMPRGADVILTRHIDDLYIAGTTLRLRRATTGDDTVFKLGQKVRYEAADPYRVALTNIYLSAQEYALLQALPGRRLRKVRTLVRAGGRTYGVDAFQDALAGLFLAEHEAGGAGHGEDLGAGIGALAEVTHDDRFSGGALACTSTGSLRLLLAGYGVSL